MPRQYTPRIPTTCGTCGTAMFVRPSRIKNGYGKFCSRTCQFAHQRYDPSRHFWPKVNKNGSIPAHCPELGPCWLWTAGLDKDGYGVSVRRKAHRRAWEFVHGSIPRRLLILHQCDTRACVRLSHLFIGTTADNVRDRQVKQRGARGERQGSARLTANQVREIRQLIPNNGGIHRGIIAVARRFGVDPSTIRQVVTYQSWKHVS